MKIEFVPVREGLSESVIANILQRGWILIGRQSVRKETAVLTLPDSGPVLEDKDVWMLPEPVVPLNVVLNILVSQRETETAAEILENVARHLTGKSFADLLEKVDILQEPQEDLVA